MKAFAFEIEAPIKDRIRRDRQFGQNTIVDQTGFKLTIAAYCRENELSQATFCKWKKRLSRIRQQTSLQITMDKEIGRILERLEDPNRDGDNGDSVSYSTLIIFINDNGGVAGKDPKSPGGQFQGVDNGPFSGFKGSPKDGGIRVPMIIAGAGVSPTAEGSVFAEPVHGIDILPTVFAAAGGEFGEEDSCIDGVNLLPYINGKIKGRPHEVLVHK